MTANYYDTLGISQSATPQEIRRAYRILARRYHPDVNPGGKTEERFKSIAQAYAVLNDEAKRRSYDLELSLRGGGRATRQPESSSHRRARQRYAEAQARARAYTQPGAGRRNTPSGSGAVQRTAANSSNAAQGDIISELGGSIRRSVSSLRNLFSTPSPEDQAIAPETPRAAAAEFLSILEVSITLREALFGGRKSFEVPFPEGPRKVSVTIPPAVRSGHLLRARARSSDPKMRGQELVFVLKVAPHPTIQLQPKGLVVEVPISINEALVGANITVPSLDEPVVVKLPPGAQSGLELRVNQRGLVQSDGSRGDIFYRVMIMVPTCHEAAGIREKSAALEQYYGESVRQSLPRNLLEMI